MNIFFLCVQVSLGKYFNFVTINMIEYEREKVFMLNKKIQFFIAKYQFNFNCSTTINKFNVIDSLWFCIINASGPAWPDEVKIAKPIRKFSILRRRLLKINFSVSINSTFFTYSINKLQSFLHVFFFLSSSSFCCVHVFFLNA